MTTLECPTMPQDARMARYVLATEPTARKPLRDGLERLERILARPVWSQSDRDRLERAMNGLWEHWNQAIERAPIWEKHECPPDCRECAMIERIDPLIKEWDRVAQAPPIPSTAQLRKRWVRPCRETRAVALAIKLSDRLDGRKRVILDSLAKKYKTAAVRYKHEQAAEDNDVVLKRINKAINRLRELVPDVGRLAYDRKYRR